MGLILIASTLVVFTIWLIRPTKQEIEWIEKKGNK